MYRKLDIWNKSLDLIKIIYNYADLLPKQEDYNLKSQLKRAIVSVNLNIAEGKSRRSTKDFIHFLNISSASLSETECILLICEHLGYLDVEKVVFENITQLNKKINALINKLERTIKNER